MKRIAVLILSILITQTYAHKKIIQMSIPKCGTFLAAKCATLLTGKTPVNTQPGFPYPMPYYYPTPHQMNKLLKLPFWFNHLMYTPEHAAKVVHPSYAPIFIYRDPRDQIISLLFFMRKESTRWPMITNMSNEDAITNMITVGTVYNNHPPAANIRNLYEKYLPWIATPGVLSIKFEDLVGPQGGGSAKKQREVIKQMAIFMGTDSRPQTIDRVCLNLWGRTTFRKVEIGAWKNYFTKKHIELFEENAGDILDLLGYTRATEEDKQAAPQSTPEE